MLDASLVMRDRETNSWWSIMSSSAIGGLLEGARLAELPVGEKATWRSWRERYPDTLVLAVDGRVHRADNPYEEYFASSETFRDLEIDDLRLQPKAPVFGFRIAGEEYAAAHAAFAGGRLFRLSESSGKRLFLFRETDAPLFESTRAWVLDAEADDLDLEALVRAARKRSVAGTAVEGFDTFWYTWISVNAESKLFQ